MARIQSIVERLERWQEWYFTASRACGLKSPSMSVKIDRPVRITGLIDFNEEEALQTDMAVAQLPEDLRLVVRAVYLNNEYRTNETVAAMLKISRMTLHRKLELADKMLFQFFCGESV